MRTALLALLLPLAAFGQCAFANQATCGSVYLCAIANPPTCPPPVPNLATTMANVGGALEQIDAQVAHLPQPKILATGSVLPGAGPYLPTALPVFGPAIIPYIDLMAGLNMTTVDMFATKDAFTCAIEYAPTGSETDVPSDCDLTGTLLEPYGFTLPALAGPRCTELWYYDGAGAHMAANNITWRDGYAGVDPGQVTACGLTPGSITVSQFIDCTKPMVRAEYARYTPHFTIPVYQVVIEPLAALSSEERFSVADVGTIIKTIAPIVTGISPNTKIQATATGVSFGVSFDPGTDLCYWLDWAGVPDPSAVNAACTTPPTGASAFVNILGIDLFSSSCDQGVQSNGLYTYTNNLLWFRGNFLGNNPNNLPVYIGQADPPIWCPSTGRAIEANAFMGRGDVFWTTSGYRQKWQDTIVRWASSVGIQSISVFCSAPWFNVTANQTQDNCGSGLYSVLAMANLDTQLSGYDYGFLAQYGPASIFQADLEITGWVSVQ